MSVEKPVAVRGFSTLEMTVVMGIIFILLGIVSLNMVNLIGGAQQETALSSLTAMFKAARQAALTQREERRVVLRATYSSEAVTRSDAYQRQPRFEVWVDRVDLAQAWDDPQQISAALTEVQALQGGVLLTDINGIGVIPNNPAQGQTAGPGLRSFESYVVFDSRGRISKFYQQGGNTPYQDAPALQCNLQIHVVFGDTLLPVEVTGSQSVDYLSLVTNTVAGTCSAVSAPQLNFNEVDEIAGRTLGQTLYLIRLTGQSVNYDYGIYAPWPRTTLPEDFGGDV